MLRDTDFKSAFCLIGGGSAENLLEYLKCVPGDALSCISGAKRRVRQGDIDIVKGIRHIEGS